MAVNLVPVWNKLLYRNSLSPDGPLTFNWREIFQFQASASVLLRIARDGTDYYLVSATTFVSYLKLIYGLVFRPVLSYDH